MVRTLTVLWCFLCFSAASCADEAPREKSLLLEEGELQTVREPLAQMLHFVFDGGRLQVDRERWERIAPEPVKTEQPIRQRAIPGLNPQEPPAVERLFMQIELMARAGSRGFSSGSGGSNNSRHRNFAGNTLRGTLSVLGDAVRISLEEVQPPARTLEVRLDDQHAFRIEVAHPAGELVILQQLETGKTVAVALCGDQTFAAQGSSFWELLRQHRAPFKEQVLSPLHHFGLHVLPAPDTPEIRRTALLMLAAPADAPQTAAALFNGLESDDFATRERATEELRLRREVYDQSIREKLRDKALPLEVRTRLQAVVGDSDASHLRQAVAALELLNDPPFLVALLDHANTAELPHVFHQLETVTDQKFGNDAAAWKEWSRAQQKP